MHNFEAMLNFHDMVCRYELLKQTPILKTIEPIKIMGEWMLNWQTQWLEFGALNCIITLKRITRKYSNTIYLKSQWRALKIFYEIGDKGEIQCI